MAFVVPRNLTSLLSKTQLPVSLPRSSPGKDLTTSSFNTPRISPMAQSFQVLLCGVLYAIRYVLCERLRIELILSCLLSKHYALQIVQVVQKSYSFVRSDTHWNPRKLSEIIIWTTTTAVFVMSWSMRTLSSAQNGTKTRPQRS